MSLLYLLVPLALGFVSIAVAVFVLMLRRGQFDDLETPAHRMLLDDEPVGDASAPRDLAGGSPEEESGGAQRDT